MVELPIFKGSGAEIAALVPKLRKVFVALTQDSGDERHQVVATAFDASVDIEGVYARNRFSFRLGDEDKSILLKKTFLFCQCQTFLIKRYHGLLPGDGGEMVPLFHYTSKFHYILHMALIGQYTNPLLGSCYQGESMMRVVKKLVRSCAHGSSPMMAGTTSLQKYIAWLHYDLSDLFWR